MKVLVVGADHLGSLKENLQDVGIKQILHWKGRSHEEVRKKFQRELKSLFFFVILLITTWSIALNQKPEDEGFR